MTIQPIIGIAGAPCAARGPYGWLTPYVAQLAASNADIAARLLILSREELHFIALVLSLMGDRRHDPHAVADLASALGRTRRQSILGVFLQDADPGLVKLAAKLAGRPWRAPAYVRLASLWGEPHARKVLAHLPTVSRRQATTLAHLPEPYRTRGVLKMIGQRRDLKEVLFAIEVVRRVRLDLTDRQILASLERADGSYIREWVMRHYEHVPFPEAPTGAISVGTCGVLRPIGTYSETCAIAREFDNCLRGSLWRVLKGDACLYRFMPNDGREDAVIELRRAPVIGWALEEAKRPRNARLLGVDREAIFKALRERGVCVAPQAQHAHAWFSFD